MYMCSFRLSFKQFHHVFVNVDLETSPLEFYVKIDIYETLVIVRCVMGIPELSSRFVGSELIRNRLNFFIFFFHNIFSLMDSYPALKSAAHNPAS